MVVVVDGDLPKITPITQHLSQNTCKGNRREDTTKSLENSITHMHLVIPSNVLMVFCQLYLLFLMEKGKRKQWKKVVGKGKRQGKVGKKETIINTRRRKKAAFEGMDRPIHTEGRESEEERVREESYDARE